LFGAPNAEKGVDIMTQFLKVKTVGEVLEIVSGLRPLPDEVVALESAYGRVLAAEVLAPEPVPHFDRSVMDGYAVRARDTFGASETMPVLLEIAGEVTMGAEVSLHMEPGKAITIPTGGMLPAGADAVVMVEYTYPLDAQTIEVTRAVAPGENVLKKGEDIAVNERLLPRGWRLRPQDLGMLAALGIGRVAVFRRPRVALLSTGDEIVPVSTSVLPPGMIRDINSFALAAQIQDVGVDVGYRAVVEDRLEALVDCCRDAFREHDVVVLSGGSSVGMRDFTVRILEGFPEAELLVHGVAIRPGKPTILARLGSKILWGLPGQPVSSMMVCRSLVLPSLAALQGLTEAVGAQDPGNTVSGILANPLPSVHGRMDYVPVMLHREGEELLVSPIFGKSAMISVLGRADGYVIVPVHVEGLERGSRVRVYLFSR
jgi:molybdopterin molybdotransferase